jgi:uroporphyrinogen decarboxylase
MSLTISPHRIVAKPDACSHDECRGHHHFAPRTSRERFLAAARCQPTDRPPVWMMRQAGRCLPEYRALKEKYSFLELVRTPDLAAEVTLQPVRRFGFDAAILFSDILVVPEALGQGYRFRDTGGVQMDFTLRDAADIERLSCDAIEDRLHYVSAALRLIKPSLGGKIALLGFAGSPWTLANFMLEGGSCPQPSRALHLLREDRALLRKLLEKLTRAVTSFLRLQIAAGVDAIQLFDSHGGLLPVSEFNAGSGEWLRRIIAEIDESVPVIVFSKGTRDWSTLTNLGANVLAIDHHADLAQLSRELPSDLALQGNLSPEFLITLSPEEIAAKTNELLNAMRHRPGYIFNLGHGVPPGGALENIGAVVNSVLRFRNAE